jgi:trk system potassium uptake protein TrkA
VARSKLEFTREQVLVVGLGRFGASTGRGLMALGHEVLAVDADATTVQTMSGDFTVVVQADGTNELAMRELGVRDYHRAVVGIGSIEDSVLCVAILADLGVREIWAKALTDRHGSILQRVGATHVVHPELDAGSRVAHLVSGSMLDFIAFDDEYAIVKVLPPRDVIGKTLAESNLRRRYGVTVVGTKRAGHDFVYATPETVVSRDDELVVAGLTRLCERFAAARAVEEPAPSTSGARRQGA